MAYIGKTPTAVPLTSSDITNGIITTAKIADDAISAAKLASGVGGKVLQVVSTTKTDVFSLSGTTTKTDVTGLSVAITPSSTSSKILITGFVGSGTSPSSQQIFIHLLRGSTEIALGDSAGARRRAHSSAVGNTDTSNLYNWVLTPVPFTTLDTPNTTSATTYKIQISGATTNGVMYINRSIRDSEGTYYDGRIVSTITAYEIAG